MRIFRARRVYIYGDSDSCTGSLFPWGWRNFKCEIYEDDFFLGMGDRLREREREREGRETWRIAYIPRAFLMRRNARSAEYDVLSTRERVGVTVCRIYVCCCNSGLSRVYDLMRLTFFWALFPLCCGWMYIFVSSDQTTLEYRLLVGTRLDGVRYGV